MASKKIFQSSLSSFLTSTPADTVNHAGGKAYSKEAEEALAQFAVTGCFGDTFYSKAEDQLKKVMELSSEVSAEFLAKLAVYSRKVGHMKDMPALLLAVLSVRDGALMEKIFATVIDNGRMLRNFVQIMRSGVVGRRSLGTRPKRLVKNWITARSSETLFRTSVGNDPSLADVIRLAHPKPVSTQQDSLFNYLTAKSNGSLSDKADFLPAVIRSFESYKAGNRSAIPLDVSFELLTALDLASSDWCQIAATAPWQMTRMNLNTFVRHGVFSGANGDYMTKLVAERLADKAEIKKARVFPYQLLAAYKYAATEVPLEITNALQEAMEVALENVPEILGKVYIFTDVSGSMSNPVTGKRDGAASKVRCIDAAALITAAILRKNRTAQAMPFERDVVELRLNPHDSVLTNADRLAAVGGGGTNCSAPLARLNEKGVSADLLIYVSDNESWMDSSKARSTETQRQWKIFKGRNPKAKMVCIDLTPNETAQLRTDHDVLNVGGFSDRVFSLIAEFAAGRHGKDFWKNEIDRTASAILDDTFLAVAGESSEEDDK